MNIKINLEDDKELRSYIKDMIKGQVCSIAREEIRGIIAEVFGKISDREELTQSVRRIFSEEAKKTVLNVLKPNDWHENYIKAAARDEVHKLIVETFSIVKK